jgi:hypothetical protein
MRPKVLGVLSYGCLLGLGLSPAAQATVRPPAAEDTVQGMDTIKGEVLRIKGEHFYVRRSDGKEMHLHTKPTTPLMGEFKKGDRIEAKVDDQNNALSIRQAK